jgi:hypothetical protein
MNTENNKTNKKILFLGSCQVNVLRGLFHQGKFSFENINQSKQVYNSNDEDIDYLYKILPEIDVLVLQPVGDKYKSPEQKRHDTGALSSKNIISKVKKDCKVIFIPVMFYKGYIPQIIRPKLFKESNLHNIDRNLLRIYYKHRYENANKDDSKIINDFINIVNDTNFYNTNLIQEEIDESLQSIKVREENIIKEYINNNDNIYLISIYESMKNNYKDKLLFQTINHPTKELYEYVFDELLNLLDLKTNNVIKCDPHSDDKTIIYSSVSKLLNFDCSCEKHIEDYAKLYISNFDKLHREKFEKFL